MSKFETHPFEFRDAFALLVVELTDGTLTDVENVTDDQISNFRVSAVFNGSSACR